MPVGWWGTYPEGDVWRETGRAARRARARAEKRAAKKR